MPASLLLLTLLAVALAAFSIERIASDVVALVLLAVLILAGWITPGEAFSGFASNAVILLMASFVISASLSSSGLSERIGRAIASARRASVLRGSLLLLSSAMSLVMSNVAAVSVLLPGATSALRRRHLSQAQNLLPIAFASQLGGMATLLTTSNLVVSEFLRQSGNRPFGLLEFLPVGGTLAAVGLVYLWIAAPRILPESSKADSGLADRSRETLVSAYQIARRLESIRILPGSSIASKTLGENRLARLLGTVVLAVVRPDGTQRRAPEPSVRLSAGDILILDGIPPDRSILAELGLEVIRIKKPTRYLASPRVALTEGVIGPRARFVGKTLRDLDFRERFGGISVLAIFRAGEFVAGDASDVPLAFGDALLMQGPRGALATLREEGEILLLGAEEFGDASSRSRAAWVGLVVASTLAAAVLFRTSPAAAFFVGAVALLATGTLSSASAYRAIDWRSVVLVGGMLPVGVALTRTGAARLLADAFLAGSHATSAPAVLAAFTILTAILTQILPGGAATPLVVAPIAISSAVHIGADPRPFALAVALATSVSLATPFAHPVNVLVMGPGGYRFRDYLRLGLPLAAILVAGILLLVPLQMPLAH